jgi:hypothetical protein
MPLPNFLIIGAQKAGTSWLHFQLKQHPEIYIPSQEIHYFDKEFNFNKGIEWYKQQFSSVTSENVIGEKTPEYLWANGEGWEEHLPEVHRNIYAQLPEVKLIIILRNPVERAVSALNHVIRSGRISPLHNFNELLIGRKQHLVKGYGILEKGIYHKQLSEYKKLFPFDQIMILIFEEDVVKAPQKTLKSIFDFVGVEDCSDYYNFDKKVNESSFSRFKLAVDYHFPFYFVKKVTNRLDKHFPKEKIKPDENTTNRLYEFYVEPNQKLYQILGDRIAVWQK